MTFNFAVASALAMLVSACGPSPTNHSYQYPPQQQYQQQAPVAPAQVVVHETGIGAGTAMLGGAALAGAGYLAGKAAAEKQNQAQHQAPANNTQFNSQPSQGVRQQASTMNYAPQPTAQPAKPANFAPQAPVQSKAFTPTAAKNTSTVTAPKTGGSFVATSARSRR